MTTTTTSMPARPQRAAASQGPDDTQLAQMVAAIAEYAADPRTDIERLPKRLSPSRASDYRTCPYAFYLRTLVKLSSPPGEPAARGTLTHATFERTFDHPPHERTPELTRSYVRPEWEKMLNPAQDAGWRDKQNADAYRKLAPAGSDTEQRILAFAEQMADNWYRMERVANINPSGVRLPNGDQIDGREVYVGAPMFGAFVHGYIDRLDQWDASTGPAYSISDYKTGRTLLEGKNYAPHTTERIIWDAFFQLRVYATLMWEVHQVPVRLLRLVYVANGDRDTGIKTMRVDRTVIDRTRHEIRTIWNAISRSAATSTWPTRTGPLCSWCDFLEICPAYRPDPTAET